MICRCTFLANSVLTWKTRCMVFKHVKHGVRNYVTKHVRFSVRVDMNSVLSHRYSTHALLMVSGDLVLKIPISSAIHSALSKRIHRRRLSSDV